MPKEDPAASIDNEIAPVGYFIVLMKRVICLSGLAVLVYKQGDLIQGVFRYEFLM